MGKKIMILGASILQLPAIQKAKQMGLEVIAVDMNPDAIGFNEEGIIKEVISTIDTPAVLKCAKKHHIDGVMTLASDMPMRTVAEIAKEMHLVGISEDTALKATNKAVMRQCLFESGVPVPKYYKVSNKDEYYGAITHFKSSFIVKPVDNSGSRGIYLVEDISAVDSIEYAYTYSQKYSRCGVLIVEEFMRGPEVSVETLTIDGICHIVQITDKITSGAPHFVEMGHTQPTQLSEDIVEKISQITRAANKAIGIQNGPSHTEIIVTSEGPKIVELGARLGGDCIATHLVPLSTGIDMVECCIKIALGEKTNVDAKFHKVSGIRYFPQTEGVVKSIRGLAEARKNEGVKQISIIHGVGENIHEVDNSNARMGFVIAQAETMQQVENICMNAIKGIEIEMGEVEKTEGI